MQQIYTYHSPWRFTSFIKFYPAFEMRMSVLTYLSWRFTYPYKFIIVLQYECRSHQTSIFARYLQLAVFVTIYMSYKVHNCWILLVSLQLCNANVNSHQMWLCNRSTRTFFVTMFIVIRISFHSSFEMGMSFLNGRQSFTELLIRIVGDDFHLW